jgi:eukaryotic-like serine/threonine-protein kinase
MLGRTIGKYRVVEKIGRGGMGTVYKAVDETLDREVAVKVLNPDLGESEVVRRFRAEAMTLARLNHPGIATIYELFRTDDDLLMVMEFVRGETFDRIVERVGPLPPARAASLGAQVLDALGHAHRVGIVHRDLKPANLMLTQYGSIKIMDFGIARVLGTEHLTSDGLMMGTPAYMAPEQVLATDVDARADLYSVGVVLYRLLSGNLPFRADTAIAMAHKQLKDPPTPLRQFRAELPSWCETVLARALAKSPADRFQTAEEFRDVLVESGASLIPIAAPAAPLETTLPPDRIPALSDRILAAGEPSAAAYAATLPVPTPVGIGSAHTPPPAPTADPAPRISATGDAAVASEPHARTGGESKGESTTVILKKQHLAVAAGLFALVVVVIGGLAVVVMRRPTLVPAASVTAENPAPAAAPSTTVPASTPPPAVGPAATTPSPASTSPGPSPAGTSTPTTKPAGPNDRASAPPPARDARRSGGAAAAAKPAPGARDAALPPLTVVDVRVVGADGNRIREREAIMTFSSGVLTVAERNGTVVRSIPYEQIMSVSYSRSQQPMWQSPGGPSPVLRVGGGAFAMFRSEPHWLSIRTREAFLVLRVGPEHIRSLPTAFSERTGVNVEIVRARPR